VALFNTSVLGILGAFLLVAGLLIAKIISAVSQVNRCDIGLAARPGPIAEL
jgi:hypothetical protein